MGLQNMLKFFNCQFFFEVKKDIIVYVKVVIEVWQFGGYLFGGFGFVFEGMVMWIIGMVVVIGLVLWIGV